MSRRFVSLTLLASLLIPLSAGVAQETKTKDKPEVPKLEACRVGDIEKIHKLDKIFLAGQPSAEDFKLAKEKEGLKTVINLRSADELEFDEPSTLKTLGVNYHHIPFISAQTLKDEVFDKARKVLGDQKNYPVMMHCASANRVGAVWLAYRVLDGKVPYEKALEEAKKVGLRSPDFEGKAKDYIARKAAK